ncbi:MAG TPA: LamG-like jellyroll fold domain-containing protein, partial [Herpetosiphonaceae bacterium]|nr:LamG-like jellyroll fold domain-containing protein [Herpetosiphonaceae bacterium]
LGYVAILADASFGCYTAADSLYWTAGTGGGGRSGWYLTLLDTGVLAMFDAQGQIQWSHFGNRLKAGQQLPAGAALISPTRQFKLSLDLDGQLVLRDFAGNPARWISEATSSSRERTFAEMQTDGNFVCYAVGRQAYWASGTSILGDGRSGWYVAVQDDGYVAIYDEHGQIQWSIFGDCLKSGQQLRVGEMLISSDHRFRFSLEADGRLAVRKLNDPQIAWASPKPNDSIKTAQGYVAVSDNGRVACYDQSGTQYWAIGLQAELLYLKLENDGTVRVYKYPNKVVGFFGDYVTPHLPALPAALPPGGDCVVNLKLDAVLPDQTTPGSGADIVIDEIFGRALQLGGNAKLNIKPETPGLAANGLARQFLVEIWAKPDPQALTSPLMGIVSALNDQGVGWVLGFSHGYPHFSWQTPLPEANNTYIQNSLLAPTPVPAAQWSHLGLSYDGTTLTLLVNGRIAATQAWNSGIPWPAGENVFALADQPAILNFFPTADPFSGRLSNLRLYNGLPQSRAGQNLADVVRAKIDEDIARTATGTVFPLEFKLFNPQGQPVIFLGDVAKTLTLRITNVGDQMVQLPIAGGEGRLELRFRPGTLDNPRAVSLVSVSPSAAWSLTTGHDPDSTDFFSLALSADTPTAATMMLPKESREFQIGNITAVRGAGVRTTRVQLRYRLMIAGRYAIEGSRLHYLSILQMEESAIQTGLNDVSKQANQIQVDAANTRLTLQKDLDSQKTDQAQIRTNAESLANRVTLLEHGVVANAKDDEALAKQVGTLANLEKLIVQRQGAPLSAGIAGVAAIICDGVSTNHLTICIANHSSDPIPLGVEGGSLQLSSKDGTTTITSATDHAAEFVIRLDGWDHDVWPWGIAKPKDLNSITIDPDLSLHSPWNYHQQDTNAIRITLSDPSLLYDENNSPVLKGNGQGVIEVPLPDFTCSAPPGQAYLVIEYANVGKADTSDGSRPYGSLTIPLERTLSVPQASYEDFTVASGVTRMVNAPRLEFQSQTWNTFTFAYAAWNAAAQTYIKGNIVSYGDRYYQCTSDHTSDSSAPPDSQSSASLWKPYAPTPPPAAAAIGLEETTANLLITSDHDITLKPTGTVNVSDLTLQGNVHGANVSASFGSLQADTVQADNGVFYTGNPGYLVPRGAIMMWSTTRKDRNNVPLNIPQGWALCDGKNHDANGDIIADNRTDGIRTPDLRNRFIVAADWDGFHPDHTGGGSVTLTTANLPAHAHGIKDPGHGHGIYNNDHGKRVTDLSSDDGDTYVWATGDSWLGVAPAETKISVEETGSNLPFDVTPAYYALFYIMKM